MISVYTILRFMVHRMREHRIWMHWRHRAWVFDKAYVASPSCCPNRASLLTGLMPARHGAHPNHSQVYAGTKLLTPILKEMGYQIASFGKVQHGRRNFEGCDFHYKDPENMSRDLKELIDSGKLENGPVCLMVGDRRPHVPWIKEMIYDPDTVTLPPMFIDTRETRGALGSLFVGYHSYGFGDWTGSRSCQKTHR